MCTNILIQENCSLQGSLNKVRCFHKQDSKEIEVMMAFAVSQSMINKGTPHICVMRLIPSGSPENTKYCTHLMLFKYLQLMTNKMRLLKNSSQVSFPPSFLPLTLSISPSFHLVFSFVQQWKKWVPVELHVPQSLSQDTFED